MYLCSVLIHLYFTVSHNNDGGHGSPRSQASVYLLLSCHTHRAARRRSRKLEYTDVSVPHRLTGACTQRYCCCFSDYSLSDAHPSVQRRRVQHCGSVWCERLNERTDLCQNYRLEQITQSCCVLGVLRRRFIIEIQCEDDHVFSGRECDWQLLTLQTSVLTEHMYSLQTSQKAFQLSGMLNFHIGCSSASNSGHRYHNTESVVLSLRPECCEHCTASWLSDRPALLSAESSGTILWHTFQGRNCNNNSITVVVVFNMTKLEML